ARREPATAGLAVGDSVDEPAGLAHRGRRVAKMRERVPGMRIRAVLRDDQVRPERSGELRHEHPDSVEPGFLSSVRLEREVDHRAGRGALAELIDEARAGKQVAAALVE